MREYATEYADYWFNVPSGFEKSGGVWLVRAGKNIAKPNYEVGPKQIECFGLHFIINGSALLEYNGNSVSLQKGDIFCLYPHISCKYRTASGKPPLEMVWLTMSGPQTEAMLEMAGITRQRPYRCKGINRSVGNALKQTESFIGGKPGGKLKLNALIHHLFALLEADVPEEAESGNFAEGDWLDWAVRYLRLHYTEPLRIEQLAQLVGVHRTHFSHVFAKTIGVSPQKFLLRLRMDRANELLRDTELSIGEIALSVGYPDLYAFSRAYKSHTGHSPTNYRYREGINRY
jgi:AraC-like DNA-binding protein